MVFSSSLVKGAPEEFPTSRKLFPFKQQDSQFDSSNGGFSFSIFRPPFWRRDSEEEKSEERKVSVDEEKEIWAAVMDRAGDEVSTESVEVPTHDVTTETVTPLKDVQTETPLMTEETSSQSTSETATDLGDSAEDSQSEASSETATDLGDSAEGSQSESTSTETKLEVETEQKPEVSEVSESSDESSVSELSDLSVDVHDEKATSTQLEAEPSVTKTEETEVSASQTEELVDTKKLETKPSSKRTQEESVMRKTGPQTVEVMTSSEQTSRQPSVAADVESTPAENKDSHHIGHNLKVVTWTLAGVCLSVVIIGNFLGIYFSYIKPRLNQSTLL